MLSSEEFLTPRLTGKRFEDHAIPLELLEDFAALEELFIEVAKWLYLEDNQERKRVPRGFSDGVSLKLSTIDEGSAILKILLVTSSYGIFPNENHSFFEKAKENILYSIEAAEKSEDVTKYIPENLLGYFNRIGKRLKDDEAIDFSPGSNLQARLTKATRKKLVLASSKITEVTIETTLRGLIPEVDKNKLTFTILIDNGGQKIIADLHEQHANTVLEAFNNYEQNCRVLITGLGKFNKYDKLVTLESIEHISILDPLDIPTRLQELSNLTDGWLNGEGSAPKKDLMKWLSEVFEDNYESSLPLPYLYPTVNGGIQAEWTVNGHEISFNMDLNAKSGFYQSLNLSNDETDEATLSLTNVQDWQTLNQKLITILKSEQ